MIKLDNFDLQEYNKNDIAHNVVINKITASDSNKYLGNLYYSIERIEQRKKENINNNAYIAYYDSYPIGYISLSFIDDSYQISYGIIPEARKQNLAALLLEEFSEYYLEDKKLGELVLKIDATNIGSQKVAYLADYTKKDNNTYTRNK